jgi:hypothetical protein
MARRFRGFGFVEFINSDDAEDAERHEDGKTIGGREVSVRRWRCTCTLLLYWPWKLVWSYQCVPAHRWSSQSRTARPPGRWPQPWEEEEEGGAVGIARQVPIHTPHHQSKSTRTSSCCWGSCIKLAVEVAKSTSGNVLALPGRRDRGRSRSPRRSYSPPRRGRSRSPPRRSRDSPVRRRCEPQAPVCQMHRPLPLDLSRSMRLFPGKRQMFWDAKASLEGVLACMHGQAQEPQPSGQDARASGQPARQERQPRACQQWVTVQWPCIGIKTSSFAQPVHCIYCYHRSTLQSLHKLPVVTYMGSTNYHPFFIHKAAHNQALQVIRVLCTSCHNCTTSLRGAYIYSLYLGWYP